jgi:nucleoside-diphosphate-sugar epimerase
LGLASTPVESLAVDMRVLVTGHQGYIGLVLVPMLLERGHDVVGLDSGLFEECMLAEVAAQVESHRIDIRDAGPEVFDGVEAVINLAALSNDPLGDLYPDTTDDINHRGVTSVARAAKQAGVERFLQSSSCSLYGAQGNLPIDESGAFLPVTPYGRSKIGAEEDLKELADANFSPTYLRNATAYGYSPRVRGDLVVNNLVAYALTTGEVLMKSDGTPWRPLAHIEDISRAFVAAMEADRDLVHNRAFNVGRTSENYQIRDVAEIVERVVPRSKIRLADTAGPDLRNYRVNCDLLAETLPGFQPVWTVEKGAEQLLEAYRRSGLTVDTLQSWRLQRVQWIKQLIAEARLGTDLRWRAA